MYTTVAFNSKIFAPNGDAPHIWHSDTLYNHVFDEEMYSIGADNLALTLNEDGTAYTIKSAVNENSLVNLTFTRTAPGLVIGKDGTTTFGTDPENPWGSMRHAFWPRCKVEGTITTKEKTYDFTGRGFFAHALQGMKPHHAGKILHMLFKAKANKNVNTRVAARWNFCNFQSPNYSAFIMEFTTPPSYGSTVVNVGAVVKDGEVIYGGATNTAQHLESVKDSENDWPEPTVIRFTWDGQTKESKPFHAEIEGPLGKRLDRIDVMSEVPGFIKSIAGSVAGTKPYIYQVSKNKTNTSRSHLSIADQYYSTRRRNGSS